GQAGQGGGRRGLRRGGGRARRLAHVRPLVRCAALRREPPHALGAARLRPRLRRAERDRRRALQVHGPLPPRARARAALVRPRHRHRLAHRARARALRQGRRRPHARRARARRGPAPLHIMILVTGAGGQVGRELLRIGTARGARIVGLARTELDVSDADAVHAALAAHRPTLVVNAAAFTTVDRAEADPGAALAANRDGPAHLADACAALDIPLIHLSTDYVFDGTKREPYTEDDATNPLNVYGASKLAGEDEVRTRLRRHVILRTSWVFSAHGHNFVRTMLRLAQQSPALSVVADQRGCPTPAIHLAVAILDIARQLEWGRDDAWGTYHLTGRGETTWYAFAQ